MKYKDYKTSDQDFLSLLDDFEREFHEFEQVFMQVNDIIKDFENRIKAYSIWFPFEKKIKDSYLFESKNGEFSECRAYLEIKQCPEMKRQRFFLTLKDDSSDILSKPLIECKSTERIAFFSYVKSFLRDYTNKLSEEKCKMTQKISSFIEKNQ